MGRTMTIKRNVPTTHPTIDQKGKCRVRAWISTKSAAAIARRNPTISNGAFLEFVSGKTDPAPYSLLQKFHARGVLSTDQTTSVLCSVLRCLQFAKPGRWADARPAIDVQFFYIVRD